MESPSSAGWAPTAFRRPSRHLKQLGELLVENGLLSQQDLLTALEEQHRSGRLLGQILIENGFVRENELVATVAGQLGVEFVDLDNQTVDPNAVRQLPVALCRRHLALPVGWDGSR